METTGRRPTDEGLVARARIGDDEAFAELVRRHREVAFRVAYLVVGSAADAEEVVQEAFVKAHRALGRFRAGAPFRPWFLRIVGNEARNHRRSSGRRLHYEQLAAVRERSTSADPEAAADRLDDRIRVLAAVDALPPSERLVVALRHLLGLSEAETARVLGIPRGTVKSRTSRAMRRLRRALEEADGG